MTTFDERHSHPEITRDDVKHASRRARLAAIGIGAAIVGSAILPNETGRRFYYRSVATPARLKRKKARKHGNKSKRRNR